MTTRVGPLTGPVQRAQFPEFAEIRRICFNRVMIKDFDTARALDAVGKLRHASQAVRLSTPNDNSFSEELERMNSFQWGVMDPLFNHIHASRKEAGFVCERT